MPLMEHLRELRKRMLRAILAITFGTITAWYFYPHILDWLIAPYERVRPALEAAGIETALVIMGIGGAFQFQLKISVISGLVISSPLWMWQLWAFVLPALHKHEKRLTVGLTALCVPLFVGGAWVGYVVFPKAIVLLVGLVPSGFESLLTGADYLTFALRMMALFGVGAQMPVVVVVLNRIGAVSGAQLVHARPWIIVGIFVFSAVATPTVDPITFLFLGVPMSLMYLVSERIAVISDRRKRRNAAAEDDKASVITGPSDVDEPDAV